MGEESATPLSVEAESPGGSGGVGPVGGGRTQISGYFGVSHRGNPDIRAAGSAANELSSGSIGHREDPLAAEVRTHDSNDFWVGHERASWARESGTGSPGVLASVGPIVG